jgi:hypothetical protein
VAVWHGVGDRGERAGPATAVGVPGWDHRDRLERGHPAQSDRSRGAASQAGARLRRTSRRVAGGRADGVLCGSTRGGSTWGGCARGGCARGGLDAGDQFAEQVGESGDDLLAREALRHLGDYDHDRGDDRLALERWRRATALGARAGAVPGTLSQQMLLAVLARDAGDEAGAAALAAEIARWAAALGAERLAAQANGFLAGADPTAPPEPGADA